jgi:hypothetical protein
MPHFLDITGNKHGRLTPIWPAGRRGVHIIWLCSCDCGVLKLVSLQNLRRGTTISCGCYRKEHPNGLRHGHAHKGSTTPEYRSWSCMLSRCRNSNDPGWKYYGGRGIRVCERWHVFENFLADMGPRPEPKARYSIDRFPNNDGNYEQGNCRWATRSEQMQTSRKRQYCKAGHAFTPENRNKHSGCRICTRRRGREWMRKKRLSTTIP